MAGLASAGLGDGSCSPSSLWGRWPGSHRGKSSPPSATSPWGGRRSSVTISRPPRSHWRPTSGFGPAAPPVICSRPAAQGERGLRRGGTFPRGLRHGRRPGHAGPRGRPPRRPARLLAPDAEWVLWHRVKDGHPESPRILEAMAIGYLQTYRLHEAMAAVRTLVERTRVPRRLTIWAASCGRGCRTIPKPMKPTAWPSAPNPITSKCSGDWANCCSRRTSPARRSTSSNHALRLKPGDARLLLGVARCHRLRDGAKRPDDPGRPPRPPRRSVRDP